MEVHNVADWVAYDKRFLLPYENDLHARVEGELENFGDKRSIETKRK